MKYFVVRQAAVPRPDSLRGPSPWDSRQSVAAWLGARAIELTHTSWLTSGFASDCGYDAAPFAWSAERRFILRCEVDAAVFHLYGLAPSQVAHVMDSFRLVRDADETEYGQFRTKHLILEIFEHMTQAIESGVPYETILDPHPADPRAAHPLRAGEASAETLRRAAPSPLAGGSGK